MKGDGTMLHHPSVQFEEEREKKKKIEHAYMIEQE